MVGRLQRVFQDLRPPLLPRFGAASHFTAAQTSSRNLRGVGDSLALQWTLFLALSAFHIYSTIQQEPSG